MNEARRPLTPRERQRYHRHLLLPEFGEEGQAKLLAARVLVIGAGGLGCPAAQFLVAAGVGTLGLVDDDRVELSNLQRQILYGPADIGRPKVEVARERLLALNPDAKIELHAERLRASNALEILTNYDLVVDGSDNFPTRYLVNDACVRLGKPMAYGAVFRFEGQASFFDARTGPCYRCLQSEAPRAGEAPSCAEAGVLGVLPGLIAMIQATEALKHLVGLGQSLSGRLLHYDALGMRMIEFALPKDPACRVCGEHATLGPLVDDDAICAGGEDAVVKEISVEELQRRREAREDFLLLDVREPQEYEMAKIDGALLIPLGQLEGRSGELAEFREKPIVIHCHHGSRSAHACRLLQQAGFHQVENLRGGIDSWSREIDPSVPQY